MFDTLQNHSVDQNAKFIQVVDSFYDGYEITKKIGYKN